MIKSWKGKSIYLIQLGYKTNNFCWLKCIFILGVTWSQVVLGVQLN